MTGCYVYFLLKLTRGSCTIILVAKVKSVLTKSPLKTESYIFSILFLLQCGVFFHEYVTGPKTQYCCACYVVQLCIAHSMRVLRDSVATSVHGHLQSITLCNSPSLHHTYTNWQATAHTPHTHSPHTLSQSHHTQQIHTTHSPGLINFTPIFGIFSLFI